MTEASSRSDSDLIGRTGEPFEFVVERGKIAEFARATMSTNPAYLAGTDSVAEPTFLAVAQHWQTEHSDALHGVPRDYKNILHGEQEFVFHGPPPKAGTVLTGQQRVENVYSKEGKRGGAMTFTVLLTEFRDASGTLVAEARGTIIATGQPPAKEN